MQDYNRWIMVLSIIHIPGAMATFRLWHNGRQFTWIVISLSHPRAGNHVMLPMEPKRLGLGESKCAYFQVMPLRPR